ncbi:pyridoxamine 5'-phosphate oxidase-domain-containing protein [Entophlyctis helioformis]|nr:pyridoxamine 5'-phosphate oxidase-domain-containing protein [Entophlyctis helioformis]
MPAQTSQWPANGQPMASAILADGGIAASACDAATIAISFPPLMTLINLRLRSFWPARLQASLAANAKHVGEHGCPAAQRLDADHSVPAVSRWPSLATVRQNGSPAVRMLSFRGLLCEAVGQPQQSADSSIMNALAFVTDSRSDKVQELLHAPAVELSWYFPETRQQFRIAGSAILLLPRSSSHLAGSVAPAGSAASAALSAALSSAGSSPEDIRAHMWQQLTPNARAQFIWPLAKHNTPGMPKDAVLALPLAPDFSPLSTASTTGPPDGSVDLLRLNREGFANFAVLLVVAETVEILDLFQQPFGLWTETASL